MSIILNFGSLNIDYVYSVDHFVSPGETISSDSLELFCGGKGLNQSVALSKSGADVYHAGKIGKDGELLKVLLTDSGVHTELIGYADSQSGHAIIQVDCSGQNPIILYGGANRKITKEFADEVFRHFGKGDILLLQNEISCLEYIMECAFKKGMRIALNPSPMNESILNLPLHYVEWFILNEIEGKAISGKEKYDEIAEAIIEKYPDSRVVLTLGKQGVYYQDKNAKLRHGIYDVKVVDTTAAGDTFTGYFLALVNEGAEIKTALEKASIASSLSVSQKGAAPSIPDRAMVDGSKLLLIRND